MKSHLLIWNLCLFFFDHCKATIIKTSYSVFRVISVALFLALHVTASHADNWIGAGVDNNWSTSTNWLDGSPPTLLDTVFFDITDSGNINVVNGIFNIGGLQYGGGGIHITDLNGTGQLQIDGAVGIGTGLGGNNATVTWTNGGTIGIGSITNLQTFDIGNFTSGNGNGSLTLGNSTVNAFISNFSVGRKSSSTGGGTASGTFIMNAGSTLNIAGNGTTKPSLNIGFNQDDIPFDGLGDAVGVLDATQGSVNTNLNELNVGYSVGGPATGTLNWNSTTPIQASAIYFSRGKNASGILNVASGASFILGSATNRVGNLRLAYDDVNSGFAGTTTANLDFTVNNPNFQAFIASGLSIGRRATGSGGTIMNGSLVLGSNSVIDLGSTATPANIYVGFNQDNYSTDGFGDAIGVLDATQGTFNANLNTVNVGVSSAGGPANGAMSMGANDTVRSTTINVGTGSNSTGVFNLTAGSLASNTISIGTDTSDQFNFTGGRLAVDTFNGDLKQAGGVLAPGVTAITSITDINGNYNLSSTGKLEIDLLGLAAGTLYDQLRVNGLVDLNADSGSGGILGLNLGFAPNLGDMFTIVANDGIDLVTATFFGLLEGGTVNEIFGGNTFTFGITYAGGTGNDIILNVASVAPVPIPAAVWLFGSGLLGLAGVARSRKNV